MQPKQTVRRRLYFEFSDALAMQWRRVSGVSGPSSGLARLIWCYETRQSLVDLQQALHDAERTRVVEPDECRA
jgi:hypothetical protein